MPPCIDAQQALSSLAAGTVLHRADADVESSGPVSVEPPDKPGRADPTEIRVLREGKVILRPARL